MKAIHNNNEEVIDVIAVEGVNDDNLIIWIVNDDSVKVVIIDEVVIGEGIFDVNTVDYYVRAVVKENIDDQTLTINLVDYEKKIYEAEVSDVLDYDVHVI